MNTMMDYPIATGPVLIKGSQATCMLPDRAVDIRCSGDVLHKLISRCDGRTAYADIVADLGQWWDAADLDAFMAHLQQEGVLAEADAVFSRLWDFIRLPRHLGVEPKAEAIEAVMEQARNDVQHVQADMHYHQVSETALKSLLEKRASTRVFGQQAVPLPDIIDMLWAAYGVGSAQHRTVPSAGALYPLQIDLINLRDIENLPQGIYRTHFAEGGRVGVARVAALPPQWLRAWVDPTLPSTAQGVFVISGNMQRTAVKYGNRAALLVPLEAGHAAQNIQLAAAQANLGVVELGGFIENTLGTLLQNPDELTPLLTVAFGTKANDAERRQATQVKQVDFRWVNEARVDYQLPFHVGIARLAGESGDWCWGRDVDPQMAYTKAVAEALERHGCANPQELYVGRYADLAHAVDPRQIVAYAPSQYTRQDFPFAPFDEHAEYLWKDGVDYASGRKVAVLADLVHWGPSVTGSQGLPYTMANTSGVAAYPTQQGALERAVLELIERDAFMRVWFSRAAMPTVEPASLPGQIQKRLQALAKIGFAVQIKDFTQAWAPVICVFAQNAAQHFTRVAAACSFDPVEAVGQALAEVETALALQVPTKKPDEIAPDSVLTPKDHGTLYAQRRYFRRADFLAAGGTHKPLRDVGTGVPRDWQALANLLAEQGKQILHLDLSYPGAALRQGREPLSIVRAIIPGLIPIHFGYGTEPLATVRAALKKSSAYSMRVQPSFPHPFP